MTATATQIPFADFMRASAKRVSRMGEELIIDNFAGGGGASTGIEVALGRSPDIAINHDPEAIEMHRRNHPQTTHLCESVWDVDPVAVCKGRPVGVAWFSPDCKHFSRAKGSKPVNKKIRGLAWVAVKWAKAVSPRVIFLENVREFQDWGPIGADNMPIKARKGDTFKRFVRQLERLGYRVEWRVCNAADFGAPTHRRRLFLIARRDGVAIVWPEPTHGIGRIPFRTAAECIDWNLPCPSIFERKRPLAEKTLRRIAMGLKRYVLENPNPFIVNVQHGGEHFRGQSIDKPLSTVTQKHGYGVVVPYVAGVGGRAGQSPETGADAPVGTITAKNDRALVTPHLVEIANSNWSEGHRPVDEPLATVTANPKGGSWAVATPYLARMMQGDKQWNGADEPLTTITAQGNKHALITPYLVGAGGPEYSAKPSSVENPTGTITGENHKACVAAFLNKYRGDSAGTHPADPLPTITSGGGAKRPAGAAHAIGLTCAHLTKFYGTANGADVREPMPTVTATGQHIAEVRAFLIKYFGCGCGQECTEPLHTITTKDRFGLVTIGGHDFQIVDIGLRMLTPRELLRAQFGPELAADYILPKTASAAVAKIGNSVAPLCAAAIVAANVPELIITQERKSA